MDWNTLYSSRVDSMGHSDVVEMLKLAEQGIEHHSSDRHEAVDCAGGRGRPSGLAFDLFRSGRAFNIR